MIFTITSIQYFLNIQNPWLILAGYIHFRYSKSAEVEVMHFFLHFHYVMLLENCIISYPSFFIVGKIITNIFSKKMWKNFNFKF